MTHTTILEGTGEELLQHLVHFPHEHFRLVPLLSDPIENEKPKPKKSHSILGKYAFVAGGSEDFARDKQTEIEREDKIRS